MDKNRLRPFSFVYFHLILFHFFVVINFSAVQPIILAVVSKTERPISFNMNNLPVANFYLKILYYQFYSNNNNYT